MLLWRKRDALPVCRVAIAGDFLPASGLQLPHGMGWRDLASTFVACFSSIDVAIVNLEGTLDVGSLKPSVKFGLGDSFSAPPEVLDFPLGLGTKIIGLANNHVYDFGEEGVIQTTRAILEKGLVPLGTGRLLSEPPDTHVAATSAGPRVGFWAAARNLMDLATQKRHGIEPATRKRAERALQQLKHQGASIAIAYLHAGMEHTNRPDPADVALMDDLARMGYDIVTACHSHRISGYKQLPRYNAPSAFCFYGLGSISSGVLYSDLEREGLVIIAGMDKSGSIVQVEVTPIHLQESGWGQIASANPATQILERFSGLSQEIVQGSYRQRFYQDIRTNLLQRQFSDIKAAVRNGGIRGLAVKLGRIRMRHLNRVFRHRLA